ncbi:hypothetical protein MalM25_35420 [Planctomycetes bacterium MalM25]|nr:hypothetical protein MalM25_35420 [Planctomycetes bacterium MalM25]
MKHIRLNSISLKNHSHCDEAWLQSVIAEDPSILGLGDLILKDRERRHANAGRLDLLLQDVNSYERYEVEIQLGASDESHLVRTIEYWDIERRRYPQYEHTAVIVAEDITSRFLNVISLFNGFIPIVALQLSTIETTEGLGLIFTKVVDTVRLGFVNEDEETAETTDRSYWQARATEESLQVADTIFEIARELTPTAEPSYNKQYIGFRVNNKACNFAVCKPQKRALRLELKLPESLELDERLETTGLNVLDYDKRRGHYCLSIRKQGFDEQRGLIKELMEIALRHRNG